MDDTSQTRFRCHFQWCTTPVRKTIVHRKKKQARLPRRTNRTSPRAGLRERPAPPYRRCFHPPRCGPGATTNGKKPFTVIRRRAVQRLLVLHLGTKQPLLSAPFKKPHRFVEEACMETWCMAWPTSGPFQHGVDRVVRTGLHPAVWVASPVLGACIPFSP